MSARYAKRVAAGHPQSTARSDTDRTSVRSIVAVMRAARSLWPKNKKADVELAARAGCGVRSAQYILAGKKGLTAEGLGRLLMSDAGPRVFRELAGQMDAKILAAYRREAEAAALRADRRALDRRLAHLEAEEI